jgi:hypothetical protein
MFDMINTSGLGNGIGMKEGTQAEAYDIDGKSLFDVPLGNATSFYANGQDEEGKDKEDADTDPDVDVPDVTVDDTGTTAMTKKKILKRTAGYTPKKDGCLCRSCLEITQDSICGAKKKGKAY